LPGLLGKSAEHAFHRFRDHLSQLLNKTITQAPLTLTQAPDNRAYLEFPKKEGRICVPVGRVGFHLFIGQTLEAVRPHYRLKTLAYAYRITEGPTFDDRTLFRWEYNARQYKESLAPRHHFHFPASLTCQNRRTLDTTELHIPTGWVTIEEIIRFFIHELKVKSREKQWDKLLCESEEKFRDWTGREEA